MMKKVQWKRYLPWILVTEGVGILSALLTMGSMKAFAGSVQQSPLTPPAIVFPIVWTVLYGLMGISVARIWNAPESKARSWGVNFFVAQLIFNFFWSLIFFNAQAFGFAVIWLGILWILTALMILAFYRVDKPAALLQIPYLIWLSFALYLNIVVWQLNPA